MSLNDASETSESASPAQDSGPSIDWVTYSTCVGITAATLAMVLSMTFGLTDGAGGVVVISMLLLYAVCLIAVGCGVLFTSRRLPPALRVVGGLLLVIGLLVPATPFLVAAFSQGANYLGFFAVAFYEACLAVLGFPLLLIAGIGSTLSRAQRGG